ncbi:MAG: hypothetical protein ACC645_23020, partial [Pirellulales bacterium]
MTPSLLLAALAITQPGSGPPPIPDLPPEDVYRLFTPLEYSASGGGSPDKKVYRYRLFEPAYGSPGEKYPMIVWLHGIGQVEIDGPENLGQLKWLGLIFKTAQRDDYPFFLLAMQLPKDQRQWFYRAGEIRADEPITVLWEIVKTTFQDYPVDEDRICLVGLSGGGSACWEMAMRHPVSFAAITPLASGGGDHLRAGLLRDVPVWAFHSNGDGPEGDRRTVAAVNRAGGTAKLSEPMISSHHCWPAAFEQNHLLPWLLAQRRGAWSVPPGVLPWRLRLAEVIRSGNWWKYVVVVVVLLLVVVAVRQERRRQARTQHDERGRWRPEEGVEP